MELKCTAYWERVGNLHIHTLASDGSADYNAVAQAAARAGLDFIVVTDHDVYVPDVQGWKGSVLLLVGEELRARENDDGSYYLVLNTGQELNNQAGDPQHLIDVVNELNGLGFIAHPFEYAGAYSGERAYSWKDWNVTGFTGIEIWNYMSEFKSRLSSLIKTLAFVLAPKLAICGPFAAALSAWDDVLADRMVWAIGGSDAHAKTYQRGIFRRQVFSYEHLFKAVNTHILVREPWTGDLTHDAGLIYEAMLNGKMFVAYDALASARGFDFTAVWQGRTSTMGDTLQFAADENNGDIRFEVTTPHPAQIRLLCNGIVVAQNKGMHLLHTTRNPGVYRVEALRRFCSRDRGWIYSNPIRVCLK